MSRGVVLLILLSGLFTYIPRLVPILALKNMRIPDWFQRWMSFLPVTIFAALIATDIFFWTSEVNLNPITNLKLLPAFLTALVAWKSKSMVWSIATGVTAIALLEWFL